MPTFNPKILSFFLRKNIVFDMFCILRSRAGCKKPHQKILFLVEVMIFLNLAHNTITIRVQTSNRDISKTLGTFFEKTIQARALKLGSYVPLMSFYKLISGIFGKIFLWPKIGLKMCQNQFFCRYLKK